MERGILGNRAGLIVAACIALVACGGAGESANDPPIFDGEGKGKSGGGGGGPTDPVTPTAPDGGAPAEPKYNAVDDLAMWSAFEVDKLVPPSGTTGHRGFFGGVAVGTRVVFAPGPGLWAVGLDGTKPFGELASWQQASRLSTAVGSGVGAATDGRYVYFPQERQTDTAKLSRWDSTLPFDAAASWQSFDVRRVDANAIRGRCPTFDGAYVYFPGTYAFVSNNVTTYSSTVRYDVKKPFDAPSSWQSFDTRKVGDLYKDLTYALTANGYVYFLTSGDVTTLGNIGIVRYDTKKPFDAAASWQGKDLRSKLGPTFGWGAAFDGRYLYVSGKVDSTNGTEAAKLARFDTTQDLASDAAWETIDTSTLPGAKGGFGMPAFDGRWVYFPPVGTNFDDGATLLRFDTKAGGAFTSAAAWQTFDISKAAAGAKGYKAAIFDGTHVYFPPSGHTTANVVLRFRARETAP
jgi:hypothetical protein